MMKSRRMGWAGDVAGVVKAKVKDKVVPALNKHQAMKTYWGSGGIARRILEGMERYITGLGEVAVLFASEHSYDILGSIKCMWGMEYFFAIWLTNRFCKRN
jgi:hypothetical protein